MPTLAIIPSLPRVFESQRLDLSGASEPRINLSALELLEPRRSAHCLGARPFPSALFRFEAKTNMTASRSVRIKLRVSEKKILERNSFDPTAAIQDR